jgi:hypothetical protein
LDYLPYICHVRAIGEFYEDSSVIESVEKRQRRDIRGNLPVVDRYLDCLVGQRCITGTSLIDIENSGAHFFFVFQDLAILLSGIFRLECTILDPLKQEIQSVLITKPFEVFPVKRLPPGDIATKLQISLEGQIKLTWHPIVYSQMTTAIQNDFQEALGSSPRKSETESLQAT